jgi:DNA modification methylase
MKPFYERDGITIYHGDALDFTEPVVADIFVTDPPYSRAGAVHTGRSSIAGTASDAAGSDQFWLYWFSSAAQRLTERTRPDGCGFVFCDYRTIALVEKAMARASTGWSVSQCLVWDRQSMGLGSPFRASHELIAFCRGPKFVWAGSKSITNVLRYRWPYGEHEHHPAEKPVSLLSFLIETTTQPGALVLDPFAGSGSTLVAARQTGREAIGMELEEVHCITAVERLSQSVMLLEA